MNLIQGISFDTDGSLSIENGNVTRKVSTELLEDFLKFESTRILENLFDNGLVQTSLVSESDRLLSHELVPFVTYPQEWTPEMLRSAALCTLDMAIALSEVGHRLHDAHPWNVTFHHGQVKYLDFSSIKRGSRLSKGWVNEFFSTFYLPLWLRSKKFSSLSQMIAREASPVGGVLGPSSTGRQIFGRSRLGRLAIGYGFHARRILQNDDPRPALLRLRKHVASLSLRGSESEWGEYRPPGGDYDDVASYTLKAKVVRDYVESLAPGRLVDIGCNRGWFTGLAKTFGHEGIGVDVDENALTASWHSKLPTKSQFDLAYLNIVWPTPRGGILSQQPSAFERWQCDTVLLVSVMHHLALRQNLGLNGVAAIPIAFGAKNVIIEWVPANDYHIAKWPKRFGTEIPDWYTEENFVAEMGRYYDRHKKSVSWTGPKGAPESSHRIMYLFQRDEPLRS